MQSNDQATRDPEAISQEIDETRARVADDVEAIAYHKTHLKEETKEAVHDKVDATKQDMKDQVVETAENVKHNASDMAGRLKDSLSDKKDDLVDAYNQAKDKVAGAAHNQRG